MRKKEICKKLANSKKRKIINNVRSAGKVGSSKRVIFPQYLFEEFDWNKGNADLRMLIGGTFQSPKANGFLVVKEGQFLFMEKAVRDFEGSMLFDFNRLEVQKIKGNIGAKYMVKRLKNSTNYIKVSSEKVFKDFDKASDFRT